MEQLTRKFLKLLTLEIESLAEELEVLIDTLDVRLQRHEITDYVRNENFATLRNEVLGLRDCIRGCEGIDFSKAQNVDELAEMARKCLYDRVQERGYVPAVYRLVSQRIDKIRRYLSVDVDASLV